jgi:hypothetical protein
MGILVMALAMAWLDGLELLGEPYTRGSHETGVVYTSMDTRA